MSDGEQHRAHFARVLVQHACGERGHGPGARLLDEPTASLDLRHQIDFISSARARSRQGTAIVAVLHDLNLAAALADRIVVLHRGSIASDDPATTTITQDMLRRVFEVEVTPGAAPNTPFVLPQMIALWPHADVTPSS